MFLLTNFNLSLSEIVSLVGISVYRIGKERRQGAWNMNFPVEARETRPRNFRNPKREEMSDTDSSHGSVQRNIRTIATAGRIPDRRVSPSGGKDRFG